MNIIVLTGGSSKRFGSDKSKAEINGKSLLEILTDGLSNLIIVGPESSLAAKYVRENPIGSGPVAAIAEALKEVSSTEVAIFATDMPFAPKLLGALKENLIHDAALPLDCDGFAQPLAAIYRTEKLRSAISKFESVENQSVKSLIAKMVIDQVPVIETELLMDIDTQEDLLKAVDLASRLAP
jgi:molybdopterin-guanine dinucleotide biosynthesis protein A